MNAHMHTERQRGGLIVKRERERERENAIYQNVESLMPPLDLVVCMKLQKKRKKKKESNLGICWQVLRERE
jgi:hypothetical protein